MESTSYALEEADALLPTLHADTTPKPCPGP
jgi:hypothetical protein